MLKAKGLPSRMAAARWDSLPPDVAGALNLDGSALLYGPPGRGKTWTAAAWFQEWVRIKATYQGYAYGDTVSQEAGWLCDAGWYNVPRLLLSFRAAIGRGDDLETLVNAVCTVGVAVLDDLGGEKNTDWTAETLYIIIAEREANALPTVVTTNLTLADLNEWHPRVASRLAGFNRIAYEGADRRVQTGGKA